MKKPTLIYVLLILAFVCMILINVVLFNLVRKVDELDNRIKQQENNLYELQTNMEGYIDNYIALWTTLNNAVAGEPEDK